MEIENHAFAFHPKRSLHFPFYTTEQGNYFVCKQLQLPRRPIVQTAVFRSPAGGVHGILKSITLLIDRNDIRFHLFFSPPNQVP
ncbi:MAG: hypothetical protein IJ174_00430, partial [Clostridia bacterium]|nr:hypothetical protein [Clostridia bacterium]